MTFRDLNGSDFFIREERKGREVFDFEKKKNQRGGRQPSAHCCPYALPRSHTPPPQLLATFALFADRFNFFSVNSKLRSYSSIPEWLRHGRFFTDFTLRCLQDLKTGNKKIHKV